jgi:hypothetical protein
MCGNGQPIQFSKQGKLHQGETDRKVCHRRRGQNVKLAFKFQLPGGSKRTTAGPRSTVLTMDAMRIAIQ